MTTELPGGDYLMTRALHNDVMDRSLTSREKAFDGLYGWRRGVLIHYYHVLRSEGQAHSIALEEAHRQAVASVLDEMGSVIIPGTGDKNGANQQSAPFGNL